jgi:hypothetical protein
MHGLLLCCPGRGPEKKEAADFARGLCGCETYSCKLAHTKTAGVPVIKAKKEKETGGDVVHA